MVSCLLDSRPTHAKGLNMRPFLVTALTAVIVGAPIALASSGAKAQQTNPFPDGPGREIIAQACTQCHQAGPITQLRMNEQGWRRQIYNMVLRGAQIGPGEIDAATAYLVAHYGPGVPVPGQSNAEVTLPDGPGASLVAGACAICHGLDRVTATNRPGKQWAPIVDRMVEIGAPLDPRQASQVLSYLEANYGDILAARK
jgi:mono/diheme cytochrome c family protein